MHPIIPIYMRCISERSGLFLRVVIRSATNGVQDSRRVYVHAEVTGEV